MWRNLEIREVHRRERGRTGDRARSPRKLLGRGRRRWILGRNRAVQLEEEITSIVLQVMVVEHGSNLSLLLDIGFIEDIRGFHGRRRRRRCGRFSWSCVGGNPWRVKLLWWRFGHCWGREACKRVSHVCFFSLLFIAWEWEMLTNDKKMCFWTSIYNLWVWTAPLSLLYWRWMDHFINLELGGGLCLFRKWWLWTIYKIKWKRPYL